MKVTTVLLALISLSAASPVSRSLTKDLPDIVDLIKVIGDDAAGSKPAVQDFIKYVTQAGLPVRDDIAAMHNFIKISSEDARAFPEVRLVQFTPRSLVDDLQDFLNILPLDKISDIIKNHLQTDGAFVDVIVYLQGDDWAELVDTVASKPAVQDFIQYLTDANFPVTAILAFMNNIIQSFVPGTEPDSEGSLKSFLDEIESILPIDDIRALFNDKLQNSPDLQNLYVKISSEEARSLVEEVRSIEEVQRLAQRLREMDASVDGALADIYAFLGWGAPKL